MIIAQLVIFFIIGFVLSSGGITYRNWQFYIISILIGILGAESVW